MENLRKNPPKNFGRFNVKAVRDYNSDERLDMTTGEKTSTNLPKSNVMYYELDQDAWCCARPSGTEPKIKFYMGVKGSTLEEAEALLAELTEELMKLAK